MFSYEFFGIFKNTYLYLFLFLFFCSWLAANGSLIFAGQTTDLNIWWKKVLYESCIIEILIWFQVSQNSKENTCVRIKKEVQAQVLSCEFCEIIKSTLFIEHPWTTAYDIIFFQFFWSGNFEKVARKSPSWYLLVQSQPWNHQNNIYLSKYLYIFIDVVLVSLSLTLTRFHKLFWCFHSCFEQATAYRHAILPISSRVACVGFAILL